LAPRQTAELRQRLLPRADVETRRVDVDGVDTYLLEAGDGPPLVLLHGGIESGAAYWAPAIPALAASHRLIVPDVPGLGESAPFASMSQAALDGWFHALLRTTSPVPPVLIAHSLLGSFAAGFAGRTGGLLRRLVVYGAPGVGPYRMPLGLLAAAVLMSRRPSESSLRRFARWPFHDLEATRRRDPEWFDRFFAYTLTCVRAPQTQRTMRWLISRYTKRVAPADLRAVTVPTALLWGERDRMVPVRVGAEAAADLGWPLHVIPGAGHVPNVEDPATFVAAVEYVLKELDDRVGRA
jgi:pimeloyl-ACP methyl ester carboxylesterase